MFIIDYLRNFFPSSPVINILIGLCSFWLIRYLISTVKRFRSLPAGPWGYPIVGYLPFLKQHIYLQFDELSKKYGPVFSLKLGKHDVVVICDWNHLKPALANDALLARPDAVFFPGIIEVPSFAEMSGDPWREHRRVSLRVLRDIGLGKNVIEGMVKEEIQSFLATLETDGKPIDFVERLLPSVSNNVSILVFGHKFDYDDPDKIDLDTNNEIIGRQFQFAGYLAFLPWAAKILSFLGKFDFDVIVKAVTEVDTYLQTEIDSHYEKSKQSDEVIDYIDGYLQERKQRQASKGNDDANGFSLDILRRNTSSFFAAGSETIVSTLAWAFLYLLKYPEYHEKIRSEIREVIGYERKPEYVDRIGMPFTVAFLYEVQRIESIIANNLLRRASRDTKVGNVNIPKNTLVIFNFWSIHHDPNVWSNPEKFDPSRFLTDNGSKTIKPPYLVPFSAGKRVCPGESLANVEMFLYLVCILQRYKITIKPGDKISFEASYGISRRPSHFPGLVFERYHQDES